MRKIVSYGLLGITIFWLIANYLPKLSALFPAFSLTTVLDIKSLNMVALILTLVFVAIQLVLILASYRLFDTNKRTPEQLLRIKTMGLQRNTELAWTVVPLLATLILVGITFWR